MHKYVSGSGVHASHDRITHNEPWCVSVLGHATGVFAPGHTGNKENWMLVRSSLAPRSLLTQVAYAA